MSKAWKFFIVIELLLLVLALRQIFLNQPSLIFLIIAVVNIVYVLRRKKRNSFNDFQLTSSVIVLILCVVFAPAIWLMFAFAIVFIGLKGIEISGVHLFQGTSWQKKQLIIPEITESEEKNGRKFKRPWIGNSKIGNSVFEWDDINFNLIAGDTIIDLGNTFLPKEDNVILIRKGFGKTRILVPVGIGLMLEHSSLIGDVTFEDAKMSLRNESVKLYSEDYDQQNRRLKIVINTLLGDVEVIRI